MLPQDADCPKVIDYTPFYCHYMTWKRWMYKWGSATVPIRALSVKCGGIGRRERTRDILLWLMTGDTCKICDLWRSCPCWSHTWRGISRGLIPAESCRNGRSHDSSLSHRSCCLEIPWTAALCDTFFTSQLSASDRNHVLKCGQVDGSTVILCCKNCLLVLGSY